MVIESLVMTASRRRVDAPGPNPLVASANAPGPRVLAPAVPIVSTVYLPSSVIAGGVLGTGAAAAATGRTPSRIATSSFMTNPLGELVRWLEKMIPAENRLEQMRRKWVTSSLL